MKKDTFEWAIRFQTKFVCLRTTNVGLEISRMTHQLDMQDEFVHTEAHLTKFIFIGLPLLVITGYLTL